MKTTGKNYWLCLLFLVLGLLVSCSESDIPEIPEHKLDVEFKYELTCSDDILKYVIPEVTITDVTGAKRTLKIEDGMWEGSGHKTWGYAVHYDSLNVLSTIEVSYIPKSDVKYQDESSFENIHNLSCFISVKEDGDGARNAHTIIPDFPSKVSVSADRLRSFFEELSKKNSIRGGSVDIKGEITKIEKD